MIFLTSDEHYGHEKIIQYENRPWRDTKAMTAAMIERHNSVVGKDDVTYHLGDVFWGDNWKQLAGLLKRLNGRHVLILGNHDHMPVWNYVEAGFDSVHTHLVVEGFVLIHDPAVAGVVTYRQYVHGHTHSLGRTLNPNTFCVCVELHDYKPVPMTTIHRHFEMQKKGRL